MTYDAPCPGCGEEVLWFSYLVAVERGGSTHPGSTGIPDCPTCPELPEEAPREEEAA